MNTKIKTTLSTADVDCELQRVDRELCTARETYQRAAHAYVLDKTDKTKATMDAAKATVDSLEGEQLGLQAAKTHAKVQSERDWGDSRLQAATQERDATIAAMDAVKPAYDTALEALGAFAQAWRAFDHAVELARDREIEIALAVVGNGNLPLPRMNFEDFLEALLFACFGELHCERTDLVINAGGAWDLSNPGNQIHAAVHRAKADVRDRTERRLQAIREKTDERADAAAE